MTATNLLKRIPLPHVQPTLTIADAGRLAYGASKAASYRMADAGALPTIYTIGSRRLVPTAELRRMLGLDAGTPLATEPPKRRKSKARPAAAARKQTERLPRTKPRASATSSTRGTQPRRSS